MSSSHARTDLACRNCGTLAPLSFCPACGQETALHAPTLGEFLHEFVGHYVALEGALWRTLGLLLLKPGRLTQEYLAGRRRRYVLPLRLYLTASFLFFLALKLLPGPVHPETQVHHGAVSGAASAPRGTVGVQAQVPASGAARSAPVPGASSSAGAALPPDAAASGDEPFSVEVDCDAAGQPACGAVERYLKSVGERFSQDAPGTLKQLGARLLGVAPYAVFFLLPVFSGILMLAYRSRRMTYGEHVVFSLHLHAFWFLALLLIAVLPAALGDWLWLAIPVYGAWALREVYSGGWAATVARAVFISLLYGVVLLAATVALVLALLAA